MKQIGIMGGTFDPIHNGHLLLGKQAHLEYGLEEIWFMPSHIPPHKKDRPVTDGEDRMQMLALALEEYPYCLVSDFEMKREGNTYTAQTLALLKQTYSEVRFFFIIGADSLFQIETWYKPAQVMAQAPLLVSGREYEGSVRTLEEQIAYLKAKYGADISILHNKEIEIASKQIRRRIANGEDIRGLVPEKVAAYIKKRKLYRYAEATLT
ncbi:MAG: nicotinate-nucleotide adenylyltransferase [Lachnospiraceae bacterium]|nr:nicotinate-nucleotide adenylyltransferase [Lachnospiraceae bacterium]